MARKGEIMPRCVCGKVVGEGSGATFIYTKTGKLLKTICPECAYKKRVKYKIRTPKEEKYELWKRFHPEEDESV